MSVRVASLPLLTRPTSGFASASASSFSPSSSHPRPGSPSPFPHQQRSLFTHPHEHRRSPPPPASSPRPPSTAVQRRGIIATPTAHPVNRPPSASVYEAAVHQGMRLILFGKPGSGKGTLSQMVLDTYPDVNLVSVGDVLRKEIAAKTEIGEFAKKLVAKGEFVPDEIMLQIALKALAPLSDEHWILDGFPRTLNQGILLDAELARQGSPLNLIINLAVSDETILKRIEDRMVHVPSGRVYNGTYNKPKVDGIDDVTGEPLTKRPDDRPEIFSHRLDLYNNETFPLLKYYGTHYPKLVHELKGETSREIWPEMHGLIQNVLRR